MSNDSSGSASFERLTKAKAVGCVAYALMIPVVAVVGAILGGAVGGGIAALLGGGETVGMVLMPAFAFVGLLGCTAFGIRDYRKRSIDGVQVYDDRLELCLNKKSVLYRFDDLQWIEGPRVKGLTLKPAKQAKLCLNAEEWPIDLIREALIQRAVPAMVRGMNARIRAGETVEFRPSHLHVPSFILVGLIMIAFSAWLFHVGMAKGQGRRGPGQVVVPILLLISGLCSLFQAARARGGVLVDRDGVRVRKNDPVIPWPNLRQLTPDGGDMILETDDGRKLRIGTLTRNYEACLAILKSGMATTE